MPIGDDFLDTSPAQAIPKKRRHYPPPDGTGALQAALPLAIRNKTLPFNATIRITIDVTED